MSAVLTRPEPPALRDGGHRITEMLARQRPVSAVGGQPSSAGFTALLGAFHSTGGTARGEDLARLLAEHLRGDYVSLARLIAHREVFCFEWRRTLWTPMFQFEQRDLSLKAGLRPILAELTGELDGWTLATWFAQSNAWLGGRRPVDVMHTDQRAVLDAARAARFGAAV